MRIKELVVSNLRSIVQADSIPLTNLFALVGENNAGKSNVLFAISALLSGGAGGIKVSDFNNQEQPITIKATFHQLNDQEKRRWKKYLVNNELILEKKVWVERDDEGIRKLKSEYHGYEAQPLNWYLSPEQILEKFGSRPKWADIALENGLPDYFLEDGNSNKTIFVKALEKYLEENDVEYRQPDLSATHALGLQSNVVSALPAFYLLPAITDYSDEIDKRQKSSTFRRLMAELSERILKTDPRFGEIEDALLRVNELFNQFSEDGTGRRLEALGAIEGQISSLLKELMPSVTSVRLSVQIEELKELFSGGVELTVNDGVETDVLVKGHGLQRCIVFSLLRTLIDTQRGNPQENRGAASIILAIEEPELYIHPQLSKLFYDVMRAFSETDQIIFTTHSPLFIDAYRYEEVGIVKKKNVALGTKVETADQRFFEGMGDRKIFKGLAKFNPSMSELFFAKDILVVEGPEDLIAVVETLKKLGKIINRPEEIGWTIIVAGGKPAIPFLQRVMNAFKLTYKVLHDCDINDNTPQQDKETHSAVNHNISELALGNQIICFPYKLEETLGLDVHLKDQYKATQYFSDHQNINRELEEIVEALF